MQICWALNFSWLWLIGYYLPSSYEKSFGLWTTYLV